MRVAIIAVAGIIAAALSAPAAQAVTAPSQGAVGIHNIQPAAEGCGRGWHWVERYRARDGRWIPGHCERNL